MVFNPLRKEMPEYSENELSLPGFWVDANGFIIFDDSSLGGCGIFEVYPSVMAPGISHIDPLEQTMDTHAEGYESTTGTYYGDARRWVIPAWVKFLNALHAADDSEESIHVQLLVKKARTNDWDTTIDYGILQTEKAIAPGSYAGNRPLLQARANQCIDMLAAMKEEAENSPSFELAALPSYKSKMYLVVPYTPSSEGWWTDGRDCDYYVTDSSSAGYISKSDFDSNKLADKIAGKIWKKNSQKSKEHNTAFDIFPISDDIAQVIETRMRKVEQICAENEMPFLLRRLNDKEAGAVIVFSDNILTSYMDKIYSLHTNYNDIFHGLDNEMAFATGDTSATTLGLSGQQIITGKIDLRLEKDAEEQFLAQYRQRDKNTLETVAEELYHKQNWDAAEALDAQQETQTVDDPAAEFWMSLGAGYSLNADDGTQAQREAEFLKQFRNRSLTVQHQQANAAAIDAGNIAEQDTVKHEVAATVGAVPTYEDIERITQERKEVGAGTDASGTENTALQDAETASAIAQIIGTSHNTVQSSKRDSRYAERPASTRPSRSSSAGNMQSTPQNMQSVAAHPQEQQQSNTKTQSKQSQQRRRKSSRTKQQSTVPVPQNTMPVVTDATAAPSKAVQSEKKTNSVSVHAPQGSDPAINNIPQSNGAPKQQQQRRRKTKR